MDVIAFFFTKKIDGLQMVKDQLPLEIYAKAHSFLVDFCCGIREVLR